jgi:hypothetical protein
LAGTHVQKEEGCVVVAIRRAPWTVECRHLQHRMCAVRTVYWRECWANCDVLYGFRLNVLGWSALRQTE